MARRRFRLFDGCPPDSAPAAKAERPILLRDLLPLISDAQAGRFAWLDDFLDDEVLVTSDLYDILQAFRKVRATA